MLVRTIIADTQFYCKLQYTNTMENKVHWVIWWTYLSSLVNSRSQAYYQFTSVPDVVRVDPAGQAEARFVWEVTPEINTKTTVRFISPQSVLMMEVYNGIPAPNDPYASRIEYIHADDTRNPTGFILGQVTTADLGNYTCRTDYLGQVDSSNDAAIYIYGKPDNPTLTTQPVLEYSDATLTCQSQSTSEPAVYIQVLAFSWYLDGIDITTNPPARHVISNYTLRVTNVSRADSDGEYTCTAAEPGGPVSSYSPPVKLNVAYLPGRAEILGAPLSFITEDDSLSFTCNVPGPYPAYPSPHTYHWRNIDTGYIHTTNTAVLDITDVTVSDHDGRFQCAVENDVGTGEYSPEVRVTVHDKPTVVDNLPDNKDVLISDTVTVSCSYRAKPAATVRWLYEVTLPVPAALTTINNTIPMDTVYSLTTGTLQWAPTATDDQKRAAGGQFVCEADNEAESGVASNNMQLTVLYPPYQISLSQPGPLTTNESDSVSVTCSTPGCSPTCSYVWTRQQEPTWSQSGPQLILNNIQRQQDDVYKCNVSNDIGYLTADVDIVVQFAAEISSFTVTSPPGDVYQGNQTTLTCQVDSQPESRIQILKEGEQTPLTDKSGVRAIQHVFTDIHVLDSANYSCVAGNGIGNRQHPHTVELNVKGPFEADCNIFPDVEGKPLESNTSVTICLSANPFDPLTQSDWRFESMNQTTGVTQSLPDGVDHSLQHTEHQYKKNVILSIPYIQLSHYGTYRLTAGNVYGTAVVTYQLTPQGPPEAPYDLTVISKTAVSIYLQWRAGFNNGAEQTFIVTVSQNGEEVSEIRNIRGESDAAGTVVSYKLTDSDGLQPSQTYHIQVGAENTFGRVSGPRKNVTTEAQVRFENDQKPVVTLHDTVAAILFTLGGPVTDIDVENCANGDQPCVTERLTVPSVIYRRKRRSTDETLIYSANVSLADAAASSFSFKYDFYDGVDLVWSYTDKEMYERSHPGSSNIMIIIGVVVAVVIAGLIVLFIVLWRKGILPKKGKPTRVNEQQGLVNPANTEAHTFSNGAAEDRGVEEINPYGTSGFAVGGAGSVADSRNNGSSSDVVGKTGPVTGEVYAVVNKPKKDKPGPQQAPEALYSQVNKNKSPTAKPGTAPKPTTVEASNDERNPSTSSGRTGRPVFPPAPSTSATGTEALYAQVNKNKGDSKTKEKKGFLGNIFKGKAKDKKEQHQPGQQYENVELGTAGPATRRGARGEPYANAHNAGEDGAYSEVNIPRIEGSNQAYGNIGPDLSNVKPFQKVGLDGTIYAELDFMGNPIPGTGVIAPPIVHGENRTEYATIDISKLKWKK